jgi:NADH:ubiquinone reductase (non-electrogenic)
VTCSSRYAQGDQRLNRPRLLILGTGFASFALLRRIDTRAYDVIVISPRNHFVFTPLLPSTTVGTIEFRTAIEPIRASRRQIQFQHGKVVRLDLALRRAYCESPTGDHAWEQEFDILALGVGCISNTFGTPGVEEHAYFLKEVEDARRIRQKLVANLERASLPGISGDERVRLLHFAAVGAGPTGVRFAAELYDLLSKELPRSYPHLAKEVRVSLVDAQSSPLGTYDETLREYVRKVYDRRGITFYTNCRVKAVDQAGMHLADGRTLLCGLWCAGFARNPLVAGLTVEKDQAGRVITDEFLQIPGHSGVYALGDCACPKGERLPQLAQVAEQQGRYLAEGLRAKALGHTVRPFRWRPWGESSYIGQGAAVADFSGHRSSGFWAYQQWRATIWTELVSTRSRIMVPLDRLRAFVFGRDLSKL